MTRYKLESAIKGHAIAVDALTKARATVDLCKELIEGLKAELAELSRTDQSRAASRLRSLREQGDSAGDLLEADRRVADRQAACEREIRNHALTLQMAKAEANAAEAAFTQSIKTRHDCVIAVVIEEMERMIAEAGRLEAHAGLYRSAVLSLDGAFVSIENGPRRIAADNRELFAFINDLSHVQSASHSDKVTQEWVAYYHRLLESSLGQGVPVPEPGNHAKGTVADGAKREPPPCYAAKRGTPVSA